MWVSRGGNYPSSPSKILNFPSLRSRFEGSPSRSGMFPRPDPAPCEVQTKPARPGHIPTSRNTKPCHQEARDQETGRAARTCGFLAVTSAALFAI